MERHIGPYWVYILENAKGTFYVGSTGDLGQRLKQHYPAEKDLRKFTHKHGLWVLVWSEEHSSRASAVKREKQIKAMKSSRWIRNRLLTGRASPDGHRD